MNKKKDTPTIPEALSALHDALQEEFKGAPVILTEEDETFDLIKKKVELVNEWLEEKEKIYIIPFTEKSKLDDMIAWQQALNECNAFDSLSEKEQDKIFATYEKKKKK